MGCGRWTYWAFSLVPRLLPVLRSDEATELSCSRRHTYVVDLLLELRILRSHVPTEGAQVCLADPSYRVDVRTGTVILCEVTSQAFIHVGRPQNQQGSWFTCMRVQYFRGGGQIEDRIPYSRKIWRGIKFGGLVVCSSNCQIKIRQNFLLAYICMAIPYRTANFKSANKFAMAIWEPTAKFNSHQYFWLYGMWYLHPQKSFICNNKDMIHTVSKPSLTLCPWSELGVEIWQYHSTASLHILEGKVLDLTTPVNFELRQHHTWLQNTEQWEYKM